jgi:hypothetical protein
MKSANKSMTEMGNGIEIRCNGLLIVDESSHKRIDRIGGINDTGLV